MTADARSLPLEVGDNFDFDSQAGILFVLRAIRAADIKSTDKNALKDLVFIYSTGGKDESVKKKLADTLMVLGVTPASVLLEAPKEVPVTLSAPAPVVTTGFMGGRLTPVFQSTKMEAEVAAPTPTPAPTPAPTPEPVASVPVIEVPKVEIPVSVTPPVVVASVEEQPVEKLVPVAPAIRPVVPVPQKEVVTPTAIVTPEPINIEVVKDVQPTPQSEISPDYVTARMERIRVIKSDVNARVGNPVNLVDVDNTLGREYMSALLEAMKLLSSASEQESSAAMSRLETVYAKVLTLLDAKLQPEVARVVEPVTPLAVASPAPVVQSQPAPEIVTPVVFPVVRSVADVPAVSQNEVTQVSPVVPIAEPFVIRSKVSEKPSEPKAASNWETASESNVDVVQSVGGTIAPADTTTTVARMSTPPAEPLRPVVAPVTPVYTPEVTPSVGEVKPLRAITELPTADEVSAVEAMSSNPLYTKDIDAGLDQLLSEWAIFKKSGLFGTGPKGREHPLYIKISGMQVPLILSGRFEGGTQEIKQSITDYMNGWRYEQGIIYEPNETFDQYLRRVIRHIIDLQKTKRRS